ncbi:MAG: hypothetical protein H6828_15535 [Planctomycetes bacterium]|nr:hypothetical protein [Planctomycetota bacterium]
MSLAALALVVCLAQDVTTPAAPAWKRARELAPGTARAETLIDALATAPEAELLATYKLGVEELGNQTRAFHMDVALPLAEALHARAGAPWSAACLGIAARKAGAPARAHAVLAEAAAGVPDGPERYALLEELGLVSLGAGDEPLARRELGASLARGSSNAGVVLGLLALRDGRRDEARALFRAQLERPEGRSWAWRGWGLSMLPGDSRPATGP